MHGWYLFHTHLPIFPVPVVQGVPAALTGASGSPLENPLITTGASPAGVAQVATLPANVALLQRVVEYVVTLLPVKIANGDASAALH